MKRKIHSIVFGLILLAGPAVFFACSKDMKDTAAAVAAQKQGKFTCPMHPNYVVDNPGDCPVCGMTLVPVEQQETSAGGTQPGSPQQAPQGKAAAGQPGKKKIMYRSTMNPNEVSDHPGKDSMGMEMEPFEVDETAPQGNVEGLATIRVSPEKQRLIGVQTAIARLRDLSTTVRATGKVAYDPDLYAAEQEYVSALQSYEQAQQSPQALVEQSSRSLLDASRMRLKILGLGNDQIETLGRRGAPDNALLLAPEGKNAWIYAAIFEGDLRRVQPGQAATVSAPSMLPRPVKGTIIAVDPVLDPATRTAKARVLIENTGSLKPEAYVDVAIRVPLGTQLTVPRDAVMDTGTRQVVFVDLGNGTLEPRKVEITDKTDEYSAVSSGLKQGEKVVTNANFLIDSESQLKATQQKAVH